MADETRISSDDVAALAQSLEPFVTGLPDQEKEVLGWILARAKAAEGAMPADDTTAPIGTALAEAAGFEAGAGQGLRGDEITVAWKHSF
jgi:hypothetical protein